ncbi:MAG: hypothetical protein EOL87_08030 [Spartobacteria bacterium]|nr:hypothetical protein [Spartobacteria bacterium]
MWSKRMYWYLLVLMLFGIMRSAIAESLILSDNVRAMPGTNEPVAFLYYTNTMTTTNAISTNMPVVATNVMIAGSWALWTNRVELEAQSNGLWKLDVRACAIPFGKHRYKFIVNGIWEAGADRELYANASSELEIPSELIDSAFVQDKHTIEVFLNIPVKNEKELTVEVQPDPGIAEWHLASETELGYRQGYVICGDQLTFTFDEKTYGMDIPPDTRVAVAGNFNCWNSRGDAPYVLSDENDDGIWESTIPLQALRTPPAETHLRFKFVLNEKHWLTPPQNAVNVLEDKDKNRNLFIDQTSKGSTSILIHSDPPLDLSQNYLIGVAGLTNRMVYRQTTPGKIMASLYSDKPIGVELNRDRNTTTYRMFAPRAKWAELMLFDGPDYEIFDPEYQKVEPVERFQMWKDPADGVWEVTLRGLDIGKYYMYRLDGAQGDGEGFSPYALIGDLYGRAAVQAERNAIVIDPQATNEWFTGWTDSEYRQIPQQDAIIYETHVRDLTFHPSSGVPPELRGTYAGMLSTTNTGTGLEYIKWLGANMVELMPLAEFNNGSNSYNWGYTTTFYFAPDSSYGRDPENGSQYYEYKTLIDGMHKEGLGVIMDVVYNHYGWPNFISMMDRKYFFRMNHDFTFSNFSACGNDIRTEAPMMRRMIVDNILYWMDEFHVDGFRFDLAELIDMDTMKAIEKAARAVNPDVLLISEPWSNRGENKHELTGTGWSAWNNDFRYAVKDFVKGKANRDWMQKCIFGSLDIWASDPLQPVNYAESHDDMALADELSERADQDGSNPTEEDLKRNLMATTILFTSLGIPMICEGQEWLRSKRGMHNTFDAGDEINALNWTERDRPLSSTAMNYYRGMMQLRGSPGGACFRLKDAPENNYYRWILPEKEQALGYVVNGNHTHPGRAFVVLINAGSSKATFTVPFGQGTWRMISDGRNVDINGLDKKEFIQGPTTIPVTLTGQRSAVYMDGF